MHATPGDEPGVRAASPSGVRGERSDAVDTGGAWTPKRTMTSVLHQADSGSKSLQVGRIRHPYRFIDGFGAGSDGASEATLKVPGTWPRWASPYSRTALPIEWAAQLYGASVRVAAGREKQPGYLAGVKEFRWAGRPAPIERVTVAPGARRGGFHEFTSDFFSAGKSCCARMAGALFFSGEPVPNVAPMASATALTDTCAGGCGYDPESRAMSVLRAGPGSDRRLTGDDGPFRVFSDLRRGGGWERRMTPRPECPVYAGHFPDQPIAPGVLLLEAMIETGRELVSGFAGDGLYLVGVKDVVFRSFVRPGDLLLVQVKEPDRAGRVHEFRASIACNGRRVASATLVLNGPGDVTRLVREG